MHHYGPWRGSAGASIEEASYLNDARCGVGYLDAAIHCKSAQQLERILFCNVLLLHQKAFCTLNVFAIGELSLGVRKFLFECLFCGESRYCDLKNREESGF